MYPISLEQLSFVGKGLSRPECAFAHESGIVLAPDWTGDGGVSVIFPDGTVKRHLATNWKQKGPLIKLSDKMSSTMLTL